jgi:hypothetical protein
LKTPKTADAFAAAVYGSITATALLSALRATHESSRGSALSLFSTMIVFWLAHAWSRFTGERIKEGAPFDARFGIEIARTEWPILEAAFGPTILLVLGWTGAISDETALTWALVVCVVQLVGWGFVAARRAHDRLLAAVGAACVDGVLGLFLVVLETSVLH